MKTSDVRVKKFMILKGMNKMKRTFKKIFASILTIALISSVCTIAPVMAEGETTATKMEFNKAYKAWWPTALPTTIVTPNSNVLTNKSLAKNANSNSHLNKEYFGTVPSSNFKFYRMDTEGGYIEVAIPAKEGCNIKTVGVTVSMNTNAGSTADSDYSNILDYAYSTDSGTTWVPIANPTYTDHGVATLYKGRWQAFCEVLKVPANATHVKITRNGNPATNGSYAYNGVCGLQFGYMPAEMGDVLEFSAGKNEEVIEFINSGIIADGGFDWNSYGYDTDGDGPKAKEYGFGVQYGKSVTINAVEGYKITSVSGTVQSGNAQRARASITLGEEEFVSTDYTESFNLTNVAGADTLTITGTCSDDAVAIATSEWTIYDLKITMEKDVEELAMEVKSAVKDAEKVDVSVQVSGRDSAADSSMKLLVVGYAGDVMSDVKILAVSKTDTSDVYSTSLSADTTSVRAFLWKDLSTLVPILPATTAFPVR